MNDERKETMHDQPNDRPLSGYERLKRHRARKKDEAAKLVEDRKPDGEAQTISLAMNKKVLNQLDLYASNILRTSRTRAINLLLSERVLHINELVEYCQHSIREDRYPAEIRRIIHSKLVTAIIYGKDVGWLDEQLHPVLFCDPTSTTED